MEGIGKFLARFEKLTLPDETARKVVSEIILAKAGVTIDITKISIKNGCVVVCAGPKAQRIFTAKSNILESLRENLGEKAPKDIRIKSSET